MGNPPHAKQPKKVAVVDQCLEIFHVSEVASERERRAGEGYCLFVSIITLHSDLHRARVNAKLSVSKSIVKVFVPFIIEQLGQISPSTERDCRCNCSGYVLETKSPATASMEYLHERPSHRDHNQDSSQQVNNDITQPQASLKAIDIDKNGVCCRQEIYGLSEQPEICTINHRSSLCKAICLERGLHATRSFGDGLEDRGRQFQGCRI